MLKRVIHLKINDAYYDLIKYENISFKYLFNTEDLFRLSIKSLTDKGLSGKVVEWLLKINPSNKHIDFEDGELKSYKSNLDGIPKENIALTVVPRDRMKDFLDGIPFEESFLYKKIEKVLYVPIIKEIDKIPLPFEDWYILKPYFLDLSNPLNEKIYHLLKSDYYFLRNSYLQLIELSKPAGTCSGVFLQLRPKGNKKNGGSKIFYKGRLVVNKTYAFYLAVKFMKIIIQNDNEEKNIDLDDYLYSEYDDFI
jgi:DNA mismatch repair protein MutH